MLCFMHEVTPESFVAHEVAATLGKVALRVAAMPRLYLLSAA